MGNSTEDYLDGLLRAFVEETEGVQTPAPATTTADFFEPEPFSESEPAPEYDLPETIQEYDAQPIMDMSEMSDTPEMLDISNMPEVSEMSELPDIPEIGDMSELSDLPELSDMLDKLDTLDISEISDIPDIPDIPDATDISDMPDISDSSDVDLALSETYDSDISELASILDNIEPEQSIDLPQDISMPESDNILDSLLDGDESDLDSEADFLDDLFENAPASDNSEPDIPMDMPESSSFEDEEISNLLGSIGELDETFAHLGEEKTSDGGTDELSSDFSGIDLSETDMSALLDEASADAGFESQTTAVDDLDLGDLLTGLGADDSELSEIGDLLSKDENSELVDPAAMFNADSDSENFDIESLLDDNEEDEESDKKKKKKKKKKDKSEDLDGEDKPKKKGFIAKIISLFFEEEEESEETSAFEQSAVEIAAEGALENEDIIKELEAAAPKKDKKKEKKKKEKKKKEKPKKEPKPKKPKKEKPPKEPEPPLKKLPKKKIIVIALFMMTVGAATIFMGVYYPQLQDISNAKKHFETGNYDKSYEYLVGHKLSDEDQELYEKTVILLKLKRQNDSYINYMKLGMRAEALNALVQGIDTMDRYAETANNLGVLDEYVNLSSTIIMNLENTFGVSVQTAREWLKYEGTPEFTKTIYDYLGLTPTNPEESMDSFFSPDISIIVQEERENDSDN